MVSVTVPAGGVVILPPLAAVGAFVGMGPDNNGAEYERKNDNEGDDQGLAEVKDDARYDDGRNDEELRDFQQGVPPRCLLFHLLTTSLKIVLET